MAREWEKFPITTNFFSRININKKRFTNKNICPDKTKNATIIIFFMKYCRFQTNRGWKQTFPSNTVGFKIGGL